MPFNVHVTFIGICAFVRNSHPTAKVRMCVALPDARGVVQPNGKIKVRKAKDKSQLRRHQAFVLFRMKDLVDAKAARGRAVGLFELNDQRIVMEAIGAANNFTAAVPNLADLGLVTKSFGDVEPGVVSERATGLVAQILLNKGALSENAGWNWTFPNTLSQVEPASRSLPNEIYLTFSGLTKFVLWVKPFQGGTAEEWNFEAPDGETVRIAIANLCDSNPLRWTGMDEALLPDEDFKWYYEILAKKNPPDKTLEEALHDLPLPIPYPIAGSANGRGVNCIPAKTNAASFDKLDQFLP